MVFILKIQNISRLHRVWYLFWIVLGICSMGMTTKWLKLQLRDTNACFEILCFKYPLIVLNLFLLTRILSVCIVLPMYWKPHVHSNIQVYNIRGTTIKIGFYRKQFHTVTLYTCGPIRNVLTALTFWMLAFKTSYCVCTGSTLFE